MQGTSATIPKQKFMYRHEKLPYHSHCCILQYYRLYPIIHLLPGINEMSLVATKQLINVHTAITGMAATVGNPNVDLNPDTHKPSQNMCIRNMP